MKEYVIHVSIIDPQTGESHTTSQRVVVPFSESPCKEFARNDRTGKTTSAETLMCDLSLEAADGAHRAIRGVSE